MNQIHFNKNKNFLIVKKKIEKIEKKYDSVVRIRQSQTIK